MNTVRPCDLFCNRWDSSSAWLGAEMAVSGEMSKNAKKKTSTGSNWFHLRQQSTCPRHYGSFQCQRVHSPGLVVTCLKLVPNLPVFIAASTENAYSICKLVVDVNILVLRVAKKLVSNGSILRLFGELLQCPASNSSPSACPKSLSSQSVNKLQLLAGRWSDNAWVNLSAFASIFAGYVYVHIMPFRNPRYTKWQYKYRCSERNPAIFCTVISCCQHDLWIYIHRLEKTLI